MEKLFILAMLITANTKCADKEKKPEPSVMGQKVFNVAITEDDKSTRYHATLEQGYIDCVQTKKTGAINCNMTLIDHRAIYLTLSKMFAAKQNK